MPWASAGTKKTTGLRSARCLALGLRRCGLSTKEREKKTGVCAPSNAWPVSALFVLHKGRAERGVEGRKLDALRAQRLVRVVEDRDVAADLGSTTHKSVP